MSPDPSLNKWSAVHIQAAMNVAIPACSLCINRRLYKIATTTTVMVTPAEKRRAIFVDLLIGLGIPCLQMVTRSCTNFILPRVGD